jgi:hypothetical protein
MLPLPVGAVAAGQLMAPAFACGINLYATVAALGLASRFGYLETLPHSLRGLEHPFVIGCALALYAVEFVVDKIPRVDSAWDALHTLIRPGAAALLVFLALEGADPAIAGLAAALAFAVAMGAHGLKAGLRLLMPPDRPASRAALSLGEDVLAVSLAFLALADPFIAAVVAALAGVLLVVFGPTFWGAAALHLRACRARLRAFFGRPSWRSMTDVPRAIRRAVPAPPLGSAPPRALRAVLSGSRAGRFRSGGLVLAVQGPAFLYRSLLGTRAVDLKGAEIVEVRDGRLTDSILLDSPRGRLTLYLFKDGPPCDLAVAELRRQT